MDNPNSQMEITLLYFMCQSTRFIGNSLNLKEFYLGLHFRIEPECLYFEVVQQLVPVSPTKDLVCKIFRFTCATWEKQKRFRIMRVALWQNSGVNKLNKLHVWGIGPQDFGFFSVPVAYPMVPGRESQSTDTGFEFPRAGYDQWSFKAQSQAWVSFIFNPSLSFFGPPLYITETPSFSPIYSLVSSS